MLPLIRQVTDNLAGNSKGKYYYMIYGAPLTAQHLTVFFFLPSEPRSFIFWIYSVAAGTLQAVPSILMVIGPIFFAAAMASPVSAVT